jgi:hypothetical protein
MAETSASRQRKIMDLLQDHRSLTIQELVAALGVSPMTVHRDLTKLADASQIVRQRGGAALPARVAAGGDGALSCAMCNQPVHRRTAFIVQSQHHGLLSACCAHCGLLLLARCAPTDLALVADFLSEQMVSAGEAAYLIDSTVATCCRPGVLAFGNRADAIAFQRGFGGEVMTLALAQEHLHARLTVACCSVQ